MAGKLKYAESSFLAMLARSGPTEAGGGSERIAIDSFDRG